MRWSYQSEGALRALAARHIDDARAIQQCTRDTRVLIAETRQLLAHPMWAEMMSACPGLPNSE